jgi:hypothetical protein
MPSLCAGRITVLALLLITVLAAPIPQAPQQVERAIGAGIALPQGITDLLEKITGGEVCAIFALRV